MGYFGMTGLYPNRIGNPDFRWETIKKREIALELGAFGNKLQFNTAYFRNNTSDQLVGYNLSSVSGFGTIIANLPANILNTGIEIDIISKNMVRRQFNWTSYANITIPKNKLISFPGIKGSSYATQYSEGEPLTSRLLFQYTGVNPQTGRYTFQDLNADGTLDLRTDGHWVFVGQRYFGGVGNTLNFKGLSLDVFFQFVKQTGRQGVSANAPGRFLGSGVSSNVPVENLERWQKTGDQSKFAKYTSGSTPPDFTNFTLQSDARVVDASFIRLKNISLSYNLPTKQANKIGLQTMRVYMQAQNLVTITNYNGLDPEGTTGNATPSLAPFRTVTLGLNVSL